MNFTGCTVLSASVLAMTTFGFVGCVDEPTASPLVEALESTNFNPPADHSHGHSVHGPHQGELIELGNENYHIEMVHDDDSGTVTFFILDGSASKQVPVESTQLTVNLKQGDQPKQFTVTAVPDADDPEGQSSRFVSEDSELAALLDEEDSEAQVVVKIGRKTWRGHVPQHDHHGHTHDENGGHDHD